MILRAHVETETLTKDIQLGDQHHICGWPGIVRDQDIHRHSEDQIDIHEIGSTMLI